MEPPPSYRWLNGKILMEQIQSFAIPLLTKIINNIPFNRTIGLSLQSITTDHITMRFDMTKDLIGNYLHGILHGGVISTVLDVAGGTAAMVSIAEKHPDKSFDELSAKLGKTSTINLNINYLRPGKGEHFIAKAFIIQSGNKITFSRMDLFNPSQELIASGTGTYFIG
jgi:uncharacterized protein (TIGR00369 family)